MRLPRFALTLIVLALALFSARAGATPLDFIPVGDHVEEELRILDVAGPDAGLPRLGMRPLQVLELPDFGGPGATPAATLARLRLQRALARDRRGQLETVRGAGPRLMAYAFPDEQRVELSAAAEGSGRSVKGLDADFTSPSGLHVRAGVQTGRWLAYTHLIAGHVVNGLSFAEALFPGSDAILHSEEAYLAYTAERPQWSVQMGRSRWHWGPGHEASLLLSKSSAPITGVALHLRVEPLRADGIVLSATLDPAGGEQLAAHRLEWQPRDGLRFGLGEAVRYKATRWEPLYWVGVLPYSMVQNLLVQDEPDSGRVLRNNVEAAFDVSWRFTPGQRVYGEVLIDDLKTDNSPIVPKYAYQLGYEGVGATGGRPVGWGIEYTRLTRYVYTSFFQRRFVAQDRPLGFPTGPDARRVRVRGSWDPSDAWQAFGLLSSTELGESGLGVPYIPGTLNVKPGHFLGVVEKTRSVELGLRWWPSAAVDVSTSVGYEWADDVGHVDGVRRSGAVGTFHLRIVR